MDMNLANVTPHLTPEGRLKNLGDWNEKVASSLVQSDGLILTEAHWEILHLRGNYCAWCPRKI